MRKEPVRAPQAGREDPPRRGPSESGEVPTSPHPTAGRLSKAAKAATALCVWNPRPEARVPTCSPQPSPAGRHLSTQKGSRLAGGLQGSP